MILLLAALSSIASPPAGPNVPARGEARVTITHGQVISQGSWTPASPGARRETVIIEKDGRRVLIRLTEFE